MSEEPSHLLDRRSDELDGEAMSSCLGWFQNMHLFRGRESLFDQFLDLSHDLLHSGFYYYLAFLACS